MHTFTILISTKLVVGRGFDKLNRFFSVSHLFNNSLLIVISQGSTQFLVSHFFVSFEHSSSFRHFFVVFLFKLPAFSSAPADDCSTAFVSQKLPQMGHILLARLSLLCISLCQQEQDNVLYIIQWALIQ